MKSENGKLVFDRYASDAELEVLKPKADGSGVERAEILPHIITGKPTLVFDDVSDTHFVEWEEQAIVWHKYPDEKPDLIPIPSTKLHTLLAVVSAGGDPEVEMVIVEPTDAMLHWRRADYGWYAPEQILYWAYLPEPPREEG